MPAPAMMTRTPRSAAVDPYSATPRGSRWAERTWSSFEIARSFSSSTAGSISSRSDSEPIRMPTSGPASSNSSRIGKGTSWRCGSAWDTDSLRGDVAAVVRAREVDALDGRVRSLSRLRDGLAGPGDVQDPAAGAHEATVPERSSGVEDDRPRGLGFVEPADLDPLLRRVGVTRRGHDHRGRGLGPGRELEAPEGSGRGGGQGAEK